MTILLSTPSLSPSRTVVLTLDNLHLKMYTLSPSLTSATITHSCSKGRHTFALTLSPPLDGVATLNQETEVGVSIDSAGKMMADVTPPSVRCWGFDGLWELKQPDSEIDGPGDRKHSTLLELFGPEKEVLNPRLAVVVGCGSMKDWRSLHGLMHADQESGVGKDADFRLVVWVLTEGEEMWVRSGPCKVI